MKTKRILSFALGVLLLLSVFASALPVASAETSQANYKRKVISVVYDDSYSMSTGDRTFYASYALQVLASTLDARDTLEIVPMHSPRITVDLTKNRNDELQRIMKEEAFKRPGREQQGRQTPYSAVKDAVDVLEANGMKQSSEVLSSDEDNTEYWLIVLTDDVKYTSKGNSTKSIKEVMEEYVISRNYNSLRTIYLTFAAKLNNDQKAELEEITSKIPFSAYSAGDGNELLTVMRKVASQLSGRYELKSGIKISEKTATIDLSSLGYSLNSISVIAQRFGGELLSATHNGVPLSIDPASTLVMSEEAEASATFKSGYSAVLSSPSGRIVGGKLVLTFSKAIDPIQFALLITPAIVIEPYIVYNGAKGKEEISSEYLNANLSPGDKISVGYRAYDEATGEPIQLSQRFSSIAGKVTYNSKTYQVDEPFPLVEGKHEITVTVDIMNGLYLLYGSLLCNVEKDPTSFRVEGTVTSEYEGNPAKSKVEFRVILNDAEIGIDNLKAKHYEYKVTAVDDAGRSHPVTVGIANGAAVAVLDATNSSSKYFKVKFVVQSDASVDPTDAKRRECVCEVAGYAFIPTTLALNALGGPTLLSQHDLEGNSQAFRFELLADGAPLSFGNPSVSYKVLLGDTDVTKYTKVENGILSYVPSDEHLSGNSLDPGEKRLTVTVSPRMGSAAPAQAENTFQLQQTIYVVEQVPSGTQKALDRFKWKHSDVIFSFRALYDGIPLTAAQMQAAYEKGELTASLPFLGSYKFTVTVEEINGQALLVCKAEPRQLKFFTQFLAPFVSGGEKAITVAYRSGSETDTITVIPNTLRYVLRILQFVAYVWLILVIIGFFTKKPLPKGVFVWLSFTDDRAEPVSTSIETCNLSFADKIKYILWRFAVPFYDQCPYRLQKLRVRLFGRCSKTFHGTISFCYKDKSPTFAFFHESDLVEIEESGRQNRAQEAFSNYLENIKNYYFDHTSKDRPGDTIPVGEFSDLKSGEARAMFIMPRKKSSPAPTDEESEEKQETTLLYSKDYFAKIEVEEEGRVKVQKLSYIIFFIEKT